DGGIHSGQLSLPGGALEAGEKPEEAALRECREELGIQTDDIRVLRRLTRLPVPPSRFVITPVLAVTGSKPVYQPSEREVQQVLDCPLNLLQDPTALHIAEREYQGSMYPVPCYVLQGHEIWGATAMILAELAALAAQPKHSNGGGAQRVKL
ncbi:MAG: CoA pyrophosphatase, partial [Spirochaetes bacterium]|nr:CoA pyrophosphatase [Spirochaetota bacterium]MBU0957125.1 CoA pyrophosphatase [Spirochaetota bacterium]